MVFKRLFGKSEPTIKAWAAPAGQRIYAVGDIHGRRDLLDDLIEKIEADNQARGQMPVQMIFLGDLCDRGPDSRAVVERLMELQKAGPHVKFLMGNHEELLIRCWEGDTRSAGLINRVGGKETMLSYGVDQATYDQADLEELCALIAAHIPLEHIDFFKGFEDWVQAGDYLFVHAGVRPGVPLDDQESSDLRWIRKDFTSHTGAHPWMVIHGHTITQEIDEWPNRIGIDTGAYATGNLTAIGIEGASRWFLTSGSN